MLKYKRLYILGIFFALFMEPLEAQKKGHSPGYIINNEGGIVEGQVKDRSTGTFIKLYSRIYFKPEGKRSKRKYGPGEILGYGFNDQHFDSMPLREESSFFKYGYYLNEGNDRVFLKIISTNKDLTYYHWEYIDGENNYLDYTPLFYRIGYDEMVRVTQGALGLKRKKLIAYFWDCPDLVRALEKKELKEIHEVFNLYSAQCAPLIPTQETVLH